MDKSSKPKILTFFKRAKVPVKTAEETKPIMKECRNYLLISIAGAAIPGILAGVVGKGALKTILEIICLIFMAGVIIFGITYYAMSKGKKRLKNLTCDKCGAPLTKNEFTEWKEISQTWRDTSSNGSTLYVLVQIKCKCEKCGTIKTFNVDLSAANTSNGNVRTTEELVNDYFNGIIHA